MARCLFGWPYTSDSATLSGGNWLAALPLANLKHALLARVARTATTTVSDTLINIDYGAASAVRIVALVKHNLQANALWRIRGSANADMSSPVYDSGWIDVWPVQWAVGVLPAGHPSAATRRLTNAQIAALKTRRDAVHVLPTETSARYWRIELDDNANTSNFLQIARLVMTPAFAPTYNFVPGSELGFDDGTAVNRSMSRVRYYDVRPVGRTVALTFENLPTDESISVVRDMMESLGVDGQVYFVSDPSDTVLLQRRSFLGNIRQLSPVQYAAAGYTGIQFALDEVL